MSSSENTDSNKEYQNGTQYECLLLVSLAKKAHELSKIDSRFKNFAIGREVKIGHRKLDDIVFRYEANDDREKPKDGKIPKRKFIFGQIKHKKDNSLTINYDSLTKAKMSGNMGDDFNLQQYFISFRTIREELENEDNKQLSEQLKNGKIKYIAIFTNIGIGKEHLEDKGCSLKEASDDIKDLFTQETNHLHQFVNVSDDLKKIFKKSSDLHILATEFAHFVVSKKYEQEKEFIMGSNKAKYHYIIKKYHVALGKEVITKTAKKNIENEIYYVGKFKEDFIGNEEPGSKKELRDAIFEAIRELNEDKLKNILRNAEWKVESYFGGNSLPDSGMPEDLHIIAREFAHFVVSKKYEQEEEFIMESNKAKCSYIIKYHVALGKEVITKTEKKNIENEIYFVAKFKEDFIGNEEPGSKKELRDAIFEAIRELDELKKDLNEDKLKDILRNAEWKVESYFGGENLPATWVPEDLRIIAREFAHFVVSKKYEQEEEFIMGSNKAMHHYIIKKYHVALVKEGITKTEKKNIENEIYYVAKFKEDFIGNEEPGSKKELRDAIFEAIGELNESKKDMSEDDLKDILRKAEWKIERNFGGNRKKNLPDKWMPVVDEDINEFLECLVFSVNQPNVIDLLTQISSEKEKNFFLRFTPGGEALDIMDEKFKDRLLKALGIPRRKENWITGKQIEEFVEEQQEALNCFIYTLLYEDKTMQYGEFNRLGKISASLDSFLNYERNEEITKEVHLLLKNSKIICVCTTVTLLTAVKILQYLNMKNHTTKNGQISIKLDDLKSEKITDRVQKAFRSENHSLLTIECIGEFSEKLERIVDLHCKFSDIIKDNPNKKIILIIEKNNLNTLTEKIRNYLNNFPEKDKQISDLYELCVHKTDEVIVKDFKPNRDPFAKNIIVFQGQKEEISLATLTGIPNWESYVAVSSPNGTQNEEFIIDAITLVKILKYQKIIVGRRPLGTDALECAYASLPEEIKEINNRNLAKKLLQQGPNRHTNVIYLVSGIFGSNEKEKMKKLFNNLGLFIKKGLNEKQLRDFGRIQITDEQFNEESFKNFCHEHLEKEIFWIYTDHENTFKLQKLFNPNFYLEREYYIYNEQSKNFLIKEDELIKVIKDRKVIIISDDHGMGKFTTMTKLFESKHLSESFLETHWIIRINLRDKIPAIKNVKLDRGIIDIVNFLSKIDSELNNNVTKSLLEFGLSNRKTTLKPLLLIFDRFDEILDGKDREKVISLLEFLKENTAAKVWISALPLYKETLEKKLMTSAIEFHPVNYKLYIKQFFKDRLRLILNKEQWDQIFDESQENSNIEIYINAFLNKIESVFTGDIHRFVGTPLHLYLMLDGSVNSFKCWVEKGMTQVPNFDYLGGDIREVHETFINKKFDIYCQKRCCGGREQSRYIFNNCNETLARCLILKSDPKSEKVLKTFKDIASLAGIIKYYRSKICFIVTSFEDFYCAKLFIDWIKGVTHDELPGVDGKKYILKEALRKPNFKLIRSFLNLEIGICFNLKGGEKNMFEEKLKQYGNKVKELFEKERNSLIDENGTVLHIAVEEGNRNIVRFLLGSLKKYDAVLKEFLLATGKDNVTALDLASSGKDDEIFNLLFYAEISVGMLGERKQEFFGRYEKNRLNALFTEIVRDINGIL